MKHIIVTVAVILALQATLKGQENSSINAKVTIHPLSYGGDPARGFAGTESMRYEFDSTAKGDLADRMLVVGLLGNVPEGIGHTLRASLWNAAAVAGQTRKDPLFDAAFTLRLKGRVDGPSAGGLFTISMLAMMQGDTLKPNVTMTGTILPDGSIGAVGGVRFKMMGAKEIGIKKVLVPEYLRVEIDLASGDVIDLEEHGGKLGLEVVFVSNIQEAYFHFTGKKLEAYSDMKIPEGKTSITLPEKVVRELKTRTKARFKELRLVLKKLLDGKAPDDYKWESQIAELALTQAYESELKTVIKDMRASTGHMQANQWVVAFEEVNRAWLTAQALLVWQKSEFEMPEQDQLKGISEKAMLAIFKHRDLLTGADTDNPVEKAILKVRAFHDGLNIYSKLQVENDEKKLYDIRFKRLEEALTGEAEREQLVETVVATLRLRAFQMLRLCKMVAIFENTGAAKGEDEFDLDLLAGAFTFRGDSDNDPRPLDPKKVNQWRLFLKTSNQIQVESLKATLKGADMENEARFDFDIRRAIALLEFDSEYNRSPQKTPFAQAVLLAKQEVEFAFAIIKVDVYGHQDGAFQGILTNARKNARLAILQASQLNYQVYGPRYDFMRAEGLRSGDPDDQLQAARLYMSASAVCRLLSACVKDAE